MVDSDGKTHLDEPYCASQKECFGGIIGAKSPYIDDMPALGKDKRMGAVNGWARVGLFHDASFINFEMLNVNLQKHK